jgi:hypothetical protein
MKKGFKAFNKGLKCLNKQYEENTEYKISDKPELCSKGFHYCENPLDVLNYYDLCDSEFAEIEDLGDTKTDNQKSVTNHIKIKGKIDLKGFIKASIDFLWERSNIKDAASGDSSQLVASGDSSQLVASGDYSQLAASGYYSQLAASGDYSQLAASGNYSQLAASGHYSQLAASGNYSQLAASGDYSKLAASGYYSQIAASGYYSQLAASGHSSQLAASGYYSQLAASGYYSQLAASGHYSQLAASGHSSQLAASGHYSQLAASGKNSVCAAIGINSKVKGIIGTWITLAEYDDNYKVICVKSAKIDGKKLKADTWYVLKGKKFIEDK